MNDTRATYDVFNAQLEKYCDLVNINCCLLTGSIPITKKREYLNELHPSYHGFKKEDYDRKIYLDNYMDLGYASINEILLNSYKTLNHVIREYYKN